MAVSNIGIKISSTAICLLLIGYSVTAQLRNGMEVGGNLMNADFVLFDTIDTDNIWGLRLGYVGEFPLSERTFLRGAVLINKRGFQFMDERWGLTVLDLPLNLGYGIPLGGNSTKLFFDAGINLEYILEAFTRISGTKTLINMGSGDGEIKRFVQGFNLSSGIQFSKGLQLRVNYYRGLTNVIRSEEDSWKNRAIGVSLCIFFFRAGNAQHLGH